MRLFSLIVVCLVVLVGCDQENNLCGFSNGTNITGKEGIVRFDSRFGTHVIFHHVPGSIDSFEVYIPCNLPESIEPNTEVIFDGIFASLPNDEKPETVIAGEEFYMIKLLTINDQSIP